MNRNYLRILVYFVLALTGSLIGVPIGAASSGPIATQFSETKGLIAVALVFGAFVYFLLMPVERKMLNRFLSNNEKTFNKEIGSLFLGGPFSFFLMVGFLLGYRIGF